METKLFELRDSMTFIPIIAIKISSYHIEEQFLIRRSGLTLTDTSVLLGRLSGREFHYDPYNWQDRTFTTAHRHILKNFDSLKSGDVIDVEFILGETAEKKASERLIYDDPH